MDDAIRAGILSEDDIPITIASSLAIHAASGSIR